MLRRKERDRANLAEKKLEELNESAAAKDAKIFSLMEKVSDGEERFEHEKLSHEKTKEALQEAKATIRQREAELQALQLQMSDHKKSATTFQQKLAALEKLAVEFEDFAVEANNAEADMEAWRQALEDRRAKALSMLEAAERSAVAVLSQLDNKGAEAQAVHALSQQVLRHAVETRGHQMLFGSKPR